MLAMQILTAYVKIGNSNDNIVFRDPSNPITYPESLVLAAVHGGADTVYDMVVQRLENRDPAAERERLKMLYGDVVDNIFPLMGGQAVLTPSDTSIPTQEEVDAMRTAADAARAKVRSKREKADKTAAPAADGVDGDGDDTPAGGNTGLPSLADLPPADE